MLHDKYSNAKFLIMGDFNCRIGAGYIDVLRFLMFGKTGMLKATTLLTREVVQKSCNAGRNMLRDFRETNNFEILNGKFGSDTREEITFISKFGSYVIDNTLASEGVINNILDFKTGVEIISTHRPLLLEL
jgi:hypothetical protein